MKLNDIQGFILNFLLGCTIISCQHNSLYIEEVILTPPLGCGEIDTIENNTIPRHEDTVYFQNDVFPILLTKCALSGCHDPITARNDVILCSYENLMSTTDIVPYDTHEGELLENITSTDPDHRMPPSPNAPLSTIEIDIILQWVQQGALNNKCME
ncbi:MAG: hypothetical protein IPI31_12895 [Bacteroidetes bacterium]|nr:hypothetical protein [Bacteroidota bacterium]